MAKIYNHFKNILLRHSNFGSIMHYIIVVYLLIPFSVRMMGRIVPSRLKYIYLIISFFPLTILMPLCGDESRRPLMS